MTGVQTCALPILDYYDRLTDALLEGHITPYATLFHWDLPQRLYELGGWMARDTGERFADYAAAVTRRLGDRLKNFITINEANVHLFLAMSLVIMHRGCTTRCLSAPSPTI